MAKMLNIENLKEISIDIPNVNWNFFECFVSKREPKGLPGLINIENCNLYVLKAFKTEVNTTDWNLH